MKHQLGIIGYGGIDDWHYNNITKRVPGIKVSKETGKLFSVHQNRLHGSH